MPLSVTRARVKERCGVSDAAWDAAVDNLLADHLPVLEAALLPEALASADPGTQATLNLGALEVVAGEFAALLGRAPGARDVLALDGLNLVPAPAADPADPSGLVAAGWERLRPYRRAPGWIGAGSRSGGERPQLPGGSP